jgi:TnpA family transposase
MLTPLNRGEGRHSLAREVFHGRRGELRQRYREGQEDQLGALGLVVNVLVLWNTIDIIKIYGVPSPKDQSSRMGGAYAKL